MNWEVKSIEETEQLAEKIAAQLKGGDLIELVGDVGTGKTTFTKALARQIGVEGLVQSPTFTICSNYEADDGLRLAHYDFYRLTEAGVMREELREAVGDKNTIIVLEWAGVVADVLPDERLTIQFNYLADEQSRMISLKSVGKRYQQIIRGIK